MPKPQVTLGKEAIRQIGVRQGVSSVEDKQVGSSSESTVTQTNKNMHRTHETDEMETVDEEENVDHDRIEEEDDKEEVCWRKRRGGGEEEEEEEGD